MKSVVLLLLCIRLVNSLLSSCARSWGRRGRNFLLKINRGTEGKNSIAYYCTYSVRYSINFMILSDLKQYCYNALLTNSSKCINYIYMINYSCYYFFFLYEGSLFYDHWRIWWVWSNVLILTPCCLISLDHRLV